MEHKPVFTIKIYGLNTNNQMGKLLSTFTEILPDDLYVYNPTFVNASINITDFYSYSHDTFASNENIRFFFAIIPFNDFSIRQRSLLELSIIKEMYPDSKIIIAYFLIKDNPQLMSFNHYNSETAATLAKSIPAESHFEFEIKDATGVKNILDSAIRIFLRNKIAIEENFVASSIVLRQGLQQPETKINTLPKEILKHILFYTTDGILRSKKEINDKFNSIYDKLRQPINISNPVEITTIKIFGLSNENKIRQLLSTFTEDLSDGLYIYNPTSINASIYLIDTYLHSGNRLASTYENDLILAPISFNDSKNRETVFNELRFLKEANPNLKIVIVNLTNSNSSSTFAKQSFFKQLSSEDLKTWGEPIPGVSYLECEIKDENNIKHMLDSAIEIFSPSVITTPKLSL